MPPLENTSHGRTGENIYYTLPRTWIISSPHCKSSLRMTNQVGGVWEDGEGMDGRDDEVAREVSPPCHASRNDQGGEGRN